eukprot:6492700-Amphidinium_carterae.6
MFEDLCTQHEALGNQMLSICPDFKQDAGMCHVIRLLLAVEDILSVMCGLSLLLALLQACMSEDFVTCVNCDLPVHIKQVEALTHLVRRLERIAVLHGA